MKTMLVLVLVATLLASNIEHLYDIALSLQRQIIMTNHSIETLARKVHEQ